MFNIGFSELFILAVIGLLVIGPEQLPDIARKLARALNELKRAKDEILSPVDDLKNEAQRMLHQARNEMLNLEVEKSLEKGLPPHEGDSVKEQPEKGGKEKPDDE